MSKFGAGKLERAFRFRQIQTAGSEPMEGFISTGSLFSGADQKCCISAE